MSWPKTVGVVLVLASLGVAPALTWRARIADAAAPGVSLTDNRALAETRVATTNGRQGIGVELEVMNLHLELAWFESVPVSPGRRVVFSWLAGASRAE